MGTFWLLGKKQFPYNVDLEKAERHVAASTYWKPSNAQQRNNEFVMDPLGTVALGNVPGAVSLLAELEEVL